MKLENKDLTLYIKKTMMTLFREERLKRGETLEQTARKINIPLYELDFLECGKNCLSWKKMIDYLEMYNKTLKITLEDNPNDNHTPPHL